MPLEPPVLTRDDAQRRVDRIQAFRAELAELERQGVLLLDEAQQARLRLFHEQSVASFAARFEIDASQAQKRLSVGMRVASLLGAVALSAAVFFFFFRFWGGLSTGVQLGLLVAGPLLALVATELAARKERTLYVAGLLGLLAFACFVLDLSVVGAIFNLAPAPGAFLAWAAFAGLLAYTYALPPLLLAAVGCATVFLAAQVSSAMGFPWDALLEHPENFLAPAAALLAAAFAPSRGWPRFPPVYRACGLGLLLLSLFVVSNWGFTSYLPWPRARVETLYQLAGFAAAGFATVAGIRRGWREVELLGTAFLLFFLLARLFDWLWDWLPRWLFFLLLGALAVGALLALRRVRALRERVAA